MTPNPQAGEAAKRLILEAFQRFGTGRLDGFTAAVEHLRALAAPTQVQGDEASSDDMKVYGAMSDRYFRDTTESQGAAPVEAPGEAPLEEIELLISESEALCGATEAGCIRCDASAKVRAWLASPATESGSGA